jgi:hypothetical protein
VSDLFYLLFGYRIRREACRLAAHAVRKIEPTNDGSYAPILWSLTVFFENYLITGADGTMDDFGPKEPATLKAVND